MSEIPHHFPFLLINGTWIKHFEFLNFSKSHGQSDLQNVSRKNEVLSKIEWEWQGREDNIKQTWSLFFRLSKKLIILKTLATTHYKFLPYCNTSFFSIWVQKEEERKGVADWWQISKGGPRELLQFIFIKLWNMEIKSIYRKEIPYDGKIDYRKNLMFNLDELTDVEHYKCCSRAYDHVLHLYTGANPWCLYPLTLGSCSYHRHCRYVWKVYTLLWIPCMAPPVLLVFWVL